jgi:hypothetical protein
MTNAQIPMTKRLYRKPMENGEVANPFGFIASLQLKADSLFLCN